MAHVLVIDDEQMILDVIKNVLVTYDFKVDTAADGESGIDMFQKNKYDIVITDMCMPKMDGNAVLHYIRDSEKSDIPVIGMSGNPILTEDVKFDKFITKPFTIFSLSNVIRSLIG